MDFYKLGKIGARAHWKKNHQPIREYINAKHNKLFKEKARMLGFLMGDGSVSKLKYPITTNQHYDISFYPDNLEVAKLFLEDFEKLYLKKPTLRKEEKYYIIRVSSKPAWEDLTKIANFSSLNWEFPQKLKSKKEQVEWARAMFDCEACVSKRVIQFQSVSEKGISSIKSLLRSFGIDSKLYHYERKNKNWNTNHILVISKKENLIKYKNLIGFNHPVKQEKLANMPACQNG